VNIVTKAGSNDFHGTLFEFHQDNFHLNTLNNQERAFGQLQPNRNLYNVMEERLAARFTCRVLAKAGRASGRYEQSLLLRRLSSCSQSRNSDWPVNQHYAVGHGISEFGGGLSR